ATDHRELVEEARREDPGNHQLALRQEVGAAAVCGACPRARAHDVRVADRVRRDAAVVEKLAVEVLVAGPFAARAAVDVDVLDLAIRDPDRSRAGERHRAGGRCGDRERENNKQSTKKRNALHELLLCSYRVMEQLTGTTPGSHAAARHRLTQTRHFGERTLA